MACWGFSAAYSSASNRALALLLGAMLRTFRNAAAASWRWFKNRYTWANSW
jgi:hypothetical protein